MLEWWLFHLSSQSFHLLAYFFSFSCKNKFKMMKIVQILLCYGLLLAMCFALNEARPSSAGDAGAVSRGWSTFSRQNYILIICRTLMDWRHPMPKRCALPMVATRCLLRPFTPTYPWIACRCSSHNTDQRKIGYSFFLLLYSYLPSLLLPLATAPTYAHRPMATWMNCTACPRASVKCGTDSATSIPSPASGSKCTLTSTTTATTTAVATV